MGLHTFSIFIFYFIFFFQNTWQDFLLLLFEQFLKQFYQEKRLILSGKPFSEMFWDKFYLKQIL